MIAVSRDIFIEAPVERVFALMADPAARSALAPHAKPIQAEIEDGETLHVGSVCHFRLQLGNRIVDYHTRVREFAPNRLIVSVSDTAVPFRISLETWPENGGTRLTHTEEFEPTDDMLRQAMPPTLANLMLEKIYWMLPFLDTDYAERLQREREEALANRLGGNLERWLAAIKQHLESGRC
ncbi:MAG: SRPBCC family protein [Pseudomonadota bacterium]